MMPSASRWCVSTAGQMAFAALAAAIHSRTQRYRCKACAGRFDDLTGTALAGNHQPLRVWVLCLYFMGLNLSNRQIGAELDLNAADVQVMTEQLRRGLLARLPAVTPQGEVEIDEIYLAAGHKVSQQWSPLSSRCLAHGSQVPDYGLSLLIPTAPSDDRFLRRNLQDPPTQW
jgi:hypothetical protein